MRNNSQYNLFWIIRRAIKSEYHSSDGISSSFKNQVKGAIMSRHIWVQVLVVVFLAVAGAAQNAPDLNTQKEKLSYALGMQVGADLRKQSGDLDLATVIKALTESFNGGKTMLTEDEMRAVLANAKEEYRKKQAALRDEEAEKNLKEGEKFLAENKTKEGVVALPTGLQYKILEQGAGATPKTHQHILCNYRGTLIDGTEFDNSNRHNGPSVFPMKGVLEGWREALLMMRVGSKWQLFIPPDLAYGKGGAPAMKVPPGATLIYELELVSIKKDEAEERDRE
jgi:FKBP-type peptidyl-prolyl cis-trans isomerase